MGKLVHNAISGEYSLGKLGKKGGLVAFLVVDSY